MIKVLSLQQPWATLVAIGAKKIETRSWNTNYRGPLAIHASKGYTGGQMLVGLQPPIMAALEAAGYTPYVDLMPKLKRLPLGAILCVCDLVDVVQIQGYANTPPEPEHSFGDYTPGRYAWILRNVQALPVPIPVKRGMLGLWTPEPDVLAQLERFYREGAA